MLVQLNGALSAIPVHKPLSLGVAITAWSCQLKGRSALRRRQKLFMQSMAAAYLYLVVRRYA